VESRPDEVNTFFSIYIIIPAALRPDFFFQFLKEIITTAVGTYKVVRILNISQPYRSPRPIAGIALNLPNHSCRTKPWVFFQLLKEMITAVCE
jgi:hypothetical protein